MANVLKHRFVSAKAAGTDPTQVQPTHWNDGHIFSGGNAGDILTYDPTDATYGAKWLNAANIGGRVDVPFSAANFAGAAPMVWTVAVGNQITFSYIILGRRVFLDLNLTGTYVTVAAGSPFSVTLPTNLPAKAIDTVGMGYDNGIATPVRVRLIAGDPIMRLYRLDGANWVPSTAQTNISFQLAYFI